jgi:hypothetical protein
MFYTFVLVPNKEQTELILVEDQDGMFLLPVFNNQFILNYELGKVSNSSDIEDNFKVLKKYSRDQIKTIT